MIDVVSYVMLGRVLVANMTGNTVLLGLALGRGDWSRLIRSTVALLGFSSGALICGERNSHGLAAP